MKDWNDILGLKSVMNEHVNCVCA